MDKITYNYFKQETIKSDMGKKKIVKEKTFAQKNANVFERLALKIVEYTLKEKIIASKNTKATRDFGVDAIIKIPDGNLTIEAKLRKFDYRLGLKDVATSIIFYMLRMNRRHYIISNVVFTNDSFSVIQKINKLNSRYRIECLCGSNLIEILENIKDSLDKNEKFLAEQLISKICRQPDISCADSSVPPFLFDWQELHVNNIINKIQNNTKCVIMDGNCGAGKSYMASAIADRLKSDNRQVVSIDCQIHSTIQQFFYKLSDSLIGVSIPFLLEEFKYFTELYDDNYSMSCEREVYEALWQVLTENYTDDVRYLAGQYIKNLLTRFSSESTIIILDNFVNCEIKLCKFICDLITDAENNLSVLIILDRNIALQSEQVLFNLEKRPNNTGMFDRENIDSPRNCDAVKFVQSQYSGDIDAEAVCRKFGTNLSVLKMVLSELKNNSVRDISLVRPSEYANICANILRNKIYGKNKYVTCCYFVLWVTGEYLDLNILTIIAQLFDVDELKLKFALLSTNLLVQTSDGITYANALVNQILCEIFIKDKAVLSDKVRKYCSLPFFNTIKPRAKIRLAYYQLSDYKDFSVLSRDTIEKYKKLYESQAELECRYFNLLFLTESDEDNVNRIKAAADFLYCYIDSDYSFGEFSNELYNIEKTEKYLSDIFSILSINGYNARQRQKFAESALKFCLYEYFVFKRKNNFSQAQSALRRSTKYFDYCTDKKLISKIVRFSALSLKELGDRTAFLNEMKSWRKNYPDNSYLQATYYANYAADCCRKDVNLSLELVQKAIAGLSKNEPYLCLWIQIDKLIYKYYAEKHNEIEDEIDSLTLKANKLCSMTDISRLENLRGAINLKNNNIEQARKNFGSAFRRLWYHEPNNIMFYLAVNYLTTLDKTHLKEYEETMDFLMNWLYDNREYISARINDQGVDRTESKIVAAIKSLKNTINIMNNFDNIKAHELCEIPTEDTDVHSSFKAGEKYVILF